MLCRSRTICSTGSSAGIVSDIAEQLLCANAGRTGRERVRAMSNGRTLNAVILLGLTACGVSSGSTADARGSDDALAGSDAGVDAPDPAVGAWSPVAVGPLGIVSSIWGTTPDNVFITGPLFQLAAGTWTLRPGASGHALWGSSAADVYLLSQSGLRHSSAGGPWIPAPLAGQPGVAWRGI